MIKKGDKDQLQLFLDKLDHIRASSHVNPNESPKEKADRISECKRSYEKCVKYYFPHYATSDCGDFQIEAANYIMKNKRCLDAEVWARGHAKSTHMDIMVPFWLWMNNEIEVMLLIGKNADDAKALLSDLQAEFEANPQIIADFGEQKKLGSWEEGQFVTKNDVAFYSLGRGQSPRGVRYKNKRPNVIVFDDIDDDEIANNLKRVLKVVKWIFSAVYGAMDNKGARMIFANNLISNTGIIFYIIKKLKALAKERKNVRVNIVNALTTDGKPTWHQKYSEDHFKEVRADMGDYNFKTEYMNNPQVEGKIFLDNQIQWCTLPRLDHFECIVGHWDVAYSGTDAGDYNAVKVWGLKDRNFYCIKAFVRQCKMAVAMNWMADFEMSLPASVKVHWRFEAQFWNDAIKMTLNQVNERLRSKNYELLLTQTERPVNNKFDRIVSQQPYYQNGRIYYNKKEEFNLDMETGLNQLKSIEPGYTSHDDSPDADEGAISYLARFLPGNNTLPVIGRRREPNAAW